MIFFCFSTSIVQEGIKRLLNTLNKYYVPTLDLPDYSGLRLLANEATVMQMEVLRTMPEDEGR